MEGFKSLINRSKPIIITISFLLLCSYTIEASNIFKNPNNRQYFGARISFLKATPDVYLREKGTDIEKHYDLFSKGYGVGFGGIYHLPIIANLYFEPGLNINLEKFHINQEALIGENRDLLQNGGILKKHSVMYTNLKIPLMIGYHLDFFKDFNLSLFLGPGFDIGLGMDARIKIEKEGKEYKTATSLFKPYQSPNDDYLRRVDCRFIMGASMNYKQYMIGFKWDLSGRGLFKTSEYNSQFYSGNFDITELCFTIGYNFK